MSKIINEYDTITMFILESNRSAGHIGPAVHQLTITAVCNALRLIRVLAGQKKKQKTILNVRRVTQLKHTCIRPWLGVTMSNVCSRSAFTNSAHSERRTEMSQLF